MNILIVNSSFSGGAAIAAQNLFKNLAVKHNNIYYLSLYQNNLPDHPNADSIYKHKYQPPSLSIKSFIRNKLFRDFELFKYNDRKLVSVKKFFSENNIFLDHISSPKTSIDITEHPYYKKCDILNFHWIAGLVDYNSFFSKNRKPISWTLHDENPYKGIFHYSPTDIKLPSWIIQYDKEVFLTKSKCILNSPKIEVIGVSDWIIERSQKTYFKNFKHHLIPNSIKANSDTSSKRELARKLLGLNTIPNVFLFVSDGLHNPRKGFNMLIEALGLLDEDYILLTVGNRQEKLFKKLNVYHFGYVYDRKLLGLIYSASDALLLPSLQDNLPNTMLEAFSQGLPVISFPNGGMKGHIINLETGILADEVTSSSFLNSIQKFIKNKKSFDSQKIVEYCILKFSLSKQSNSYFSVFKELLG